VESFDDNLESLRELMAVFGMRELPKLSDRYHDYYFTNIE